MTAAAEVTAPTTTAVGPPTVDPAAPAVPPALVVRVRRRTLGVLVATQMLGGVGVTLGVAVGSLLASALAGTDALAGLAATAAVVGAAVLAVPVSRVMDARGRRPGLVLAYATGAVGALLVVLAGVIGSLVLGLVGMVLFGGGTAANLQARYAATDLAPPAGRGLPLSMVVWATTVGSVAGPNLAGPTGRLADGFGVPALAGPFLLSAAVFALAAALIATLLRPDPLRLARQVHRPSAVQARPRASVRTALRTVRARPDAVLGLTAVSVGHAVMVGLMAMTPVHMGHGGASLTVIGVVISVHVAGMFALSPLVGWLADRRGRRTVIGLGVVLLLVAAAVAGTASEHSSVQLGVGLTLLGLGWSCTLIAGSTLLTEAVPALERPSVQGTADLVMGISGAAAGLLSGVVIGVAGYPVLALAAGLMVLPLAAAMLRRPRRAAEPTR